MSLTLPVDFSFSYDRLKTRSILKKTALLKTHRAAFTLSKGSVTGLKDTKMARAYYDRVFDR